MRFNSDVGAAAKAGGMDFGNVIRTNQLEYDIPYKFRILNPIIPVKKVMYPCLVPDAKTGVLRLSWRSVRLPVDYKPFGWKKVPTVIDVLSDIDLKIRLANRPVGVTEDIKSFFEPQKLWVCPVFDRRDNAEAPVIKFLEVNWTIIKGLLDLRSEPDEDDPTKLAFGPHWVHDVLITKTHREDPKTTNLKEAYNVTYKIKSSKNNKFAGKIPISVVSSEDKSEEEALYQSSVEVGIFTETEYGVIEMFSEEAEMLPNYQPNTPDEIIKTFIEFPLCLDATNKFDNSYIFPNKLEFAKELSEYKKQIAYGTLSESVVNAAESNEPVVPEDIKKEPIPVPQKEEPKPTKVEQVKPEGKVTGSKPAFLAALEKEV